MEPAALDRIGPDDILEQAPLGALAEDGELFAYRHDGFWACRDTFKEKQILEDVYAKGRAPWKVWDPKVAKGSTAA